MLWAALLLPCAPDGTPPRDALCGTATWALQFTPRVALADEAVVIEVEASARLFGGRRALRDRVVGEARELGVVSVAWAANSLAARALARAGIGNGFGRPLPELLDALPLEVLPATAPHRLTLVQLGCRMLGEVRALPRAGLARRFGPELLHALDQAYGLQPEAHEWVVLPEAFRARLELMARVEAAPALLFGARRLLVQMSGWLAARHAGTASFTLRWAHDAMRARAAGEGGEITIRTAQPMRDTEHFARLLAEHLAHVPLAAPVGDLELEAGEAVPLAPASGSLLKDRKSDGEPLARVLERIAARLGPDRVLRPVLVADHRPERAQRWQPADQPLPGQRVAPAPFPQPTFVLPAPLRLAVRGERPQYQGPLQLLAGPHRIEGGWWDRAEADGVQQTRHVARDYWVALSPRAGVLWVFREHRAGDASPWFLHGLFA